MLACIHKQDTHLNTTNRFRLPIAIQSKGFYVVRKLLTNITVLNGFPTTLAIVNVIVDNMGRVAKKNLKTYIVVQFFLYINLTNLNDIIILDLSVKTIKLTAVT